MHVLQAGCKGHWSLGRQLTGCHCPSLQARRMQSCRRFRPALSSSWQRALRRTQSTGKQSCAACASTRWADAAVHPIRTLPVSVWGMLCWAAAWSLLACQVSRTASLCMAWVRNLLLKGGPSHMHR